MALTIAIEGTGIIANCDAITDTAGGGWAELGGGSITDESDAFIYGATSIGMKYASKSGWTYINKTTPLNFGTGGSQEGEFIYIWLNIAAPNAFDTLANKGFALRLGTDTTNYREWIIAGEDDANGWAGGWKLFVLDPTKTGSVTDTGTFNLSSVDLVGIWIDTNASVRAESIFIDQIACGKGLRITGSYDSGTYDGAWEEVLAYCTDYTNRAWGMLQERDGILYGFGKFYIGDTTQSANTVFEDSGKVIQFGTSQYYISSAWASTMPLDACGIVIEDHASYTTKFVDGVIVGTDNGRSGSVYIGNDDQNVIMDLYGGNNAASETLCYGTSFKDIKGAFNSGNDTDHKFLGCSFSKCSQFDPVGGPVIRNCVFAETINIDSSLLWNANIDIEDCAFIVNTLGAAIEHEDIITDTYTNLIFSSNTKDILNSLTPITTDSNIGAYNGTIGLVPTRTRLSQSITGDGNELSNIGFFLKKGASPTGDLTAQLWTHTGTFGTSSVPGTLIATSKIIDASVVSINTPPEEVIFHFERGNTIVNGTKYCVVITFETAGSGSDLISAAREGDGSSHDGNHATYNGSTWTAETSYDLKFHVRTNATVQISKSGTSNPINIESPNDTTTLVLGSVPLTITVVDATNTPITTANVRLEKVDGTLISQGNVNGSGIYSSSFTGDTPLTVSIVVRSSSSGETRYFSVRTGGTIASTTGLVTTITLQKDPIAGS